MTMKQWVRAGICALVLGSVALAQVAGPDAGERPRQGRRGAGAEGGRRLGSGEFRERAAAMQLERLNKELNLTQEQQDKIKTLINAHQEAQRGGRMEPAQREEMMKLREQLQAAQQAGDTTKADQLRADMRKAMNLPDEKAVKAAREKLVSDVNATLTDDQKKKFADIKDEVFGPLAMLRTSAPTLMRAVESLKLPAEKNEKIRAIFEEYRSKARGAQDREAAREQAPELYNKVMAELSAEEKAKLKEWQPSYPWWGEGGQRGPGREGEGGRDRGDRGERGARRRGAGAGGAAQPQQ